MSTAHGLSIPFVMKHGNMQGSTEGPEHNKAQNAILVHAENASSPTEVPVILTQGKGGKMEPTSCSYLKSTTVVGG